MTIKVGVLGARGRMGSTVCAAVEADEELSLVAQIDEDDSLEGLVQAGAAVAVDFTTPSVVKDNVRFCLENSVHAVVGTTGLTDEDLAEIASLCSKHGTNAFIAPNFALGAVLMMEFARQAAPHFDSAEIIERHHENKVDAPSGTALRTARLMNEARGRGWVVPGSEKETLAGSRGGADETLHIHSVRLRGSVAHQEVIFGSAGETLTIKHDSLDRASFMPGVVLAIKKVGDTEGLTVGLEHLLGL